MAGGLLDYGGGSDFPEEKGVRSEKDGVEARKDPTWRGAVHRSAGTRFVGLSGQKKRCSVV